MRTEIDQNGLVQLCNSQSSSRVLIGIAGPPGGGKSTVAEELVLHLSSAAILPMDGFHYDDILLNELGRKQRKGAADTFDVDGFKHLLLRFKANVEPAIAVPIFDRSIEIARAGARLISHDVKIIIVEGNYLFLKQKPWDQLLPLFDVTVMVETPPEVLRARLTQRWQSYNISPEEIQRRVEENDMPNGKFVMAESATTDFVIRNQ